MKINFFRLHQINQRLYKRAITKIFFDHCYYKDTKMREQMHRWTVNVYPTNDIEDKSSYWDGLIDVDAKVDKRIPHGNTGLFVINLFILDVKNEFVDNMNFSMTSHEIAHAVIMLYYGTKRKDLFVDAVHELVKMNKIRTLKFWFFNRSLRFIRRVRLRILDITEITNTSRHNNGKSPYFTPEY